MVKPEIIANPPPRVQRFQMRLMRYYYTIVYVAGKEHVSADALSPAPVDEEEHYTK